MLNFLLRVFASLQIVMAGNGICQTGVDDSAKDTITGASCHFLHTLWIIYVLPAMLSPNISNQQTLKFKKYNYNR